LTALIAGGANAITAQEATTQCSLAAAEYMNCYFKSYVFTGDDLFNQMNNMCITYFSDKCKYFFNTMRTRGVIEGCEYWQKKSYE